MWIVRLALRRPYTFIVMSLLILILGVLAIFRTPVDIFPVVDIPVVSVIWTYNGMGPEEMTNRITTNTERAFTTTVVVCAVFIVCCAVSFALFPFLGRDF